MDAADLARTYQSRFEAKETYRYQVWQVLISRFFQRYVKPDATVLDLGCGYGEFINQVRAGKKYAMDLNPSTREKLRPEVSFLQQDCSKTWALEEKSLDVVFTSNFFEHLLNKDLLGETLDQARRCLKPGGKLICLGPNIRFLAGSYWDFWDHYLALTDLSLKEGLELHGFQVKVCIPRFLPYSMSQGFQPPVGLVALYLGLPFLWPLFGRQFMLVAETSQKG
jgi:SAM-dependent methyltransferase